MDKSTINHYHHQQLWFLFSSWPSSLSLVYCFPQFIARVAWRLCVLIEQWEMWFELWREHQGLHVPLWPPNKDNENRFSRPWKMDGWAKFSSIIPWLMKLKARRMVWEDGQTLDILGGSLLPYRPLDSMVDSLAWCKLWRPYSWIEESLHQDILSYESTGFRCLWSRSFIWWDLSKIGDKKECSSMA